MDTHHITPISVYVKVYVILMLLLFATWAISRIQLGPWNNVAAMTIAIIKATLVFLFFMGVKYSSKLTWVWATAGFLWLLVLFGVLIDYMSRGWIPVKGW